jgi:hypothetical protein
MRQLLFFIALILITATGLKAETPHDIFVKNIAALCGKAFQGKVVSTDAADADFAKETLVMHIRQCSADRIEIPFHVGENRSRTWVITQQDNALTLKHDHRHEDGVEDKVTQYGGTTKSIGSKSRQEFPADEFSKHMFTREGLAASVANTWAVEIHENETFVYELSRPNRLFRVSFDLTNPITPPPAPWGH